MRITLGLVNTYEGTRLDDPHVRAIARAAPLCEAFDLDLALVAFPDEAPQRLVDRVAAVSNVGEGGDAFRRLVEEGRVHVFERVSGPEMPRVGSLVATTSEPDNARGRSPEDLIARGDDVLLLVGLGRHGLPKEIADLAPFHLELTGKRVALETATAMGAIAQRMATARGDARGRTVVVLRLRRRGEVVAVRHENGAWGLPWRTLRPGETPEEAAESLAKGLGSNLRLTRAVPAPREDARGSVLRLVFDGDAADAPHDARLAAPGDLRPPVDADLLEG